MSNNQNFKMSMKTEYIDQVDKNGQIIKKVTLAEAHSDPELIHPVVHCFIFNEYGHVLLQKRSMRKKFGAGSWDISVGGHVQHKENPAQGLAREMSEELGLDKLEVSMVSKYLNKEDKQTELVYLFYGFLDSDQEISFSKEEIEMVAWFEIKDLLNEVKNGNLEVTKWIFLELPIILQKFAEKTFSLKNK